MLEFDRLRQVNVERCEDAFFELESWSPSDWGLAMGGEGGEAAEALAIAISGLTVVGKCGQAQNAVKKLNRGDGSVEAVAKELADLIIYADLLAARLGIDLGQAVIDKFNEVSDKKGSSVKL